jgi:enterochelin esterase-like enzyme
VTTLIETRLRSHLLDNQRQVWVQPPDDAAVAARGPALAGIVLLDAEYYVERIGAPAVIAELQQAALIPPVSVLYLSHIDGASRWTESFCNLQFARFLGEEVVAWARSQMLPGFDGAPLIVGGLSLTGLAAAHAALFGPRVFAGVLCQSASFWWLDNRLIDEARSGGHVPLVFRLSCGLRETAENVSHGPELFQRTSQLEANRAMRDTLRQRGHNVSWQEFSGGHGVRSWKRDLPGSLTWLLGQVAV